MRLIDADKVLAEFPVRRNHHDEKHSNMHFINGIETVMEYLDEIADTFPIEAEYVRHGYIVKKKRVIGRVEHHKCPECSHTWQKDKRCKIDEWLCSECNKVLAHNYTNFCPNCGAKMDGGNKNG